MDMHRDSGFVGRLEVVDTGRRRRWGVGEKIRIVEESLSGHRQASATARRYGIPTSLLFRWRRDYREGCLATVPAPAFVAAVVAPATGRGSGGICVSGHMEIALPDGTRVTVAAYVDMGALGRVLDALERRR